MRLPKQCHGNDGQTNKGHHKNPTGKMSGFIQASFLPNKAIRRASEQTSPQVARAVGPALSGQKMAG
jgi:hypothetical protein